MAKIVVDTVRWPLVVVRYPPVFTDEEWSAQASELDELFKRRTRFVMLSDASRIVSAPSAKQRRFAAEKIDARREDWARYCAGAAFVTPSPLVRGVMTAINWASPPPFTQRVFATVEEGEAWLQTLEGVGAVPRTVG